MPVVGTWGWRLCHFPLGQWRGRGSLRQRVGAAAGLTSPVCLWGTPPHSTDSRGRALEIADQLTAQNECWEDGYLSPCLSCVVYYLLEAFWATAGDSVSHWPFSVGSLHVRSWWASCQELGRVPADSASTLQSFKIINYLAWGDTGD